MSGRVLHRRKKMTLSGGVRCAVAPNAAEESSVTAGCAPPRSRCVPCTQGLGFPSEFLPFQAVKGRLSKSRSAASERSSKKNRTVVIVRDLAAAVMWDASGCREGIALFRFGGGDWSPQQSQDEWRRHLYGAAALGISRRLAWSRLSPDVRRHRLLA
jgi:hypothetical protein